MKLCNLASLDPAHQQRGVKGLTKVSAGDRDVWDEFHSDWTRLAIESENLRAARVESNPDETLTELSPGEPYEGDTERNATTKIRVAQQFFRRAVMATYEARCCISNIQHRALLIASHILPWSSHPAERANPSNGLCLSSIHDVAFDRGLMTFDEEYRVVLSQELRDHLPNRVMEEAFVAAVGKPINLPTRFMPRPEFLLYHRERIFRG